MGNARVIIGAHLMQVSACNCDQKYDGVIRILMLSMEEDTP